jgi:hypothetical protein
MTNDEFKNLAQLYAKKRLAEEEIVVFNAFTEQVPMLSFDEYVEWVKQFEDFYTVICLISGGEEEHFQDILKNDYYDLVKVYEAHHNSKDITLKEELAEVISAATSFYEYRANQLFLNKMRNKPNGMSEETINNAMSHYLNKRRKWFDLREKLLNKLN